MIKNVNIRSIRMNSLSNYSEGDLEGLAESIHMSRGLIEPLTVMEEGDDYKILSGRRRYLALRMLVENGFTEYESVPVNVKESINPAGYPLSEESQEEIIIIAANRYRKKTDDDIYAEDTAMTRIINELKAAGVEEADFGMGLFRIAGRTTRSIVTEQTGESGGKSRAIAKIRTNGSSALNLAVKNGTLNIRQAEMFLELSKDQQDKVLDRIGDRMLKTSEIKELIDEEKGVIKTFVIDGVRINSQIGEIYTFTKEHYDTIGVSERDVSRYNRLVKELKGIIGM